MFFHFLKKNTGEKRNLRNSGFSIIETIVATGILVLALIGPLTVAEKSLSANLNAKDKMTANYLAEDALEYIYYMRHNNSMDNRNWLDGLTDCVNSLGASKKYCTIDTITGNIDKSANGIYRTGGNKNLLYINSATKRYTHSSGGNIPANFFRIINIERSVDNSTATVSVWVKWYAGGRTTGASTARIKEVSLKEIITDWRRNPSN